MGTSLADLHKQREALNASIDQLEKEDLTKNLENAIKEKEFLQGIWKIHPKVGILQLEGNHAKFGKLQDRFQYDYHCSFELGEGAKLLFSDYDVFLVFEDLHQAQAFIKKYKLKLNIQDIKTLLAYNEEEILNYKMILNQVEDL